MSDPLAPVDDASTPLSPEETELLRQRARPYLFSNSLPPSVVAASIEATRLVESGDDLRDNLFENTLYWREGLNALGFK